MEFALEVVMLAVGDVDRSLAFYTWAGGFAPGVDDERRGYASFAHFADPDGNTWVLQERGYQG